MPRRTRTHRLLRPLLIAIVASLTPGSRVEVVLGAGESLGLQVQSITSDIARALRLSTTDGVVVSQIAPGGLAAEAGMRRGEVVRGVNRKPITDLRTYRETLTQLDPDAPVLFLLERWGNGLYVALKPHETD